MKRNHAQPTRSSRSRQTSDRTPICSRSEVWRLRLRRGAGRRVGYWGHTDRIGSVLLVVLGLMLALMLVGFTFLTFSSQEHSSAEYYADASKVYGDVNVDALFDFGLEQLIVGPPDANTQSALWPGDKSLIPNMLGVFQTNPDFPAGVTSPRDKHAYDGSGFNIISGPQGQPIVDADHDGVADPPAAGVNVQNACLFFNYSPSATQSPAYVTPFPGSVNRTTLFNNLPAFDAGYTYPDRNSLFLAHVGRAPSGELVLIPSFHRPQYLRDTGGTPLANWWRDVNTVGRILTPHVQHRCVANTNYERFLAAQAPYPPLSSGLPTTRYIQPFFDTLNNDPIMDPSGNGTRGEQGVWTAAGLPNNIDFLVDNDNDGTREGMWLDLGFPIQTLPDGRSYVCLYSYTVIDADGLVNVNVHGNLAGILELANTTNGWATVSSPFSQNVLRSGPFSRSNLGVSPCEINPFWALNADPQNTIAARGQFLNPANTAANPPPAVLQQYRGFYGRSNLNSTDYVFSQVELANMDLLQLLWGRPKYDVTIQGSGAEQFAFNDLVEGRWGERSQLITAAGTGNGWNGTAGSLQAPTSILPFPRPGTRAATSPPSNQWTTPDAGDDDGDMFEGQAIDYVNNQIFYVNKPSSDPYLQNVPVPAFGSPTDYSGAGVNHATNPGVGEMADLYVSAPCRWIKYSNYSYAAGSSYMTALGGQLAPNPRFFSNIDEGDETIVDLNFRNAIDQIFGPDEMAALHLSPADRAAVLLGTSRLGSLMSFNLESNLQAAQIRKRFTTDQWDRLTHAFGYNPFRPWEYQANWDGTGGSQFPPSIMSPNPVNITIEPFRLPLAAAIGAKLGNTTFTPSILFHQLRLNINRLATTPIPVELQPMSTNNPPIYRHLTPHPQGGLPATPITTAMPAFAPPFAGNPVAQEYWARRDRQQMARDIYVMLYVLGGGNDINYLTTSNALPAAGPRPVYADWQLQEMAQFAVNVVDALDPDSIITRFEFDTDLSNGWNLDDNPYTVGPTEVTDRAEVYGVEAQSLVLTEADCVYWKDQVSNDNKTLFDETNSRRYFTYLELHNVSPQAVPLQNGGWRVRVISAMAPSRSVVFRGDGLNNSAQIQPNVPYTIGGVTVTDNGVGAPMPPDTVAGAMSVVHRSADFRYDDGADGQFERYCPNPQIPVDNPPTGPNDANIQVSSNLDLVQERDQNRFMLVDHGAPGTQVPQTGTDVTATEPGRLYAPLGPGDTNIDFLIERRLDPTRPDPLPNDAAGNDDNPWVVVDRFRLLKVSQFDPATGGANSESEERRDVLDRALTQPSSQVVISPGANLNYLKNSLGRQQNSAYTNSAVYQPHFDRDFASVMELLSIPLYGPDQVTARLSNLGVMRAELVPPLVPAANYEARIAQAKFLRPLYPPASAPASGSLNPNNRWYRVLELLEVPPRTLAAIAAQNPNLKPEQLPQRVPGKMNLNALRNQENLFALLDDPYGFTFPEPVQDRFEPARDWWFQLQMARDGRDPGAGNLVLPGSVASRPFRPLGYGEGPLAVAPAAGLNAAMPPNEKTILRHLLMDVEDLNGNGLLDTGEWDFNSDTIAANNAAAQRQIFESRPTTDLVNNAIDYQMRHRLLTKMAGNTTTRSNVFIVWMTVGFFEAYQPDPVTLPDVVQIGAEMTDQPRRRGFFIVDRTLLEDAYVPSSTAGNPGTFDFRKFIQYRRTLQ